MDTRLPQIQLSLNVVSFVDRDMVMRYFGGGIGHLKNTPPQQLPGFDPIDPTSKEMAMEEEDEDLGTVVQPSSDVTNGRELEVNEDDEDDEDEDEDEGEDDSDSDESGLQTDEDEEGEGEGEDDYDHGFASD